MLTNILLGSVTLVVVLLIMYVSTRLMANNLDNVTAKKAFKEASDSVRMALAHASKRYFDACDTGNEETALPLALEAAKFWLTKSATGFIETAYGDVDAYLISKIKDKAKQ